MDTTLAPQPPQPTRTMKAFGLVLLLASSVLPAPQGEPNEANEINQVSGVKQLKARQLAFGQGEQVFVQSTPQFGARLSQGVPAGAQLVYLQGGYQQPQYSYSQGQQIAYVAGAPAQQSFVTGAPAQAYHSGAPAQAYYSGASAQFAQPQFAVKKTIVKPSAYKVSVAAPQQALYKSSVSAFKAQAPPAFTAFKTQAAPSFAAYKAPLPAPAPAPAVFKVSGPAPQAPSVRISSAPAPVSYSSSISAEPPHVIVKQFEDNNFDGSFTYNFETDHGIAVESSGFLKNAGTEDEVQVIQGSYTYYSPEGIPITTTYIADENGFQVQGDHLPVPPPLPEAIAKSIEYQRSLPPSPEEQAAAIARQ